MVGETASMDAGERAVTMLFEELGLKFNLRKKKATSHCFIPGTETIVTSDDSSALGSFGLLSPVSLSNYDIGVPVFYATISLSAVTVGLGKAESERAALYPQFYGSWIMPDVTIAALVNVGDVPVTVWGKDLSRKLVKTAELYMSHIAPCEFKVFEKEFEDLRISLWLVSKNGTLCNESVLDEIFVNDGSIVSVPPTGKNNNPSVYAARRFGIRTGIRILNSFADMVAARVEKNPQNPQRFSVAVPQNPTDVNISIPGLVADYMRSKNKQVLLGGDLGITTELRVKRLWVHEQPQ
jgi:O-phosphoseryl-tRNA synthetase